MSRTATGADDHDVVVVGAGPAGLAAAITLGRYGVRTLLVDRRIGPPAWPRATAVSTRTMELVRRWGLEDAVARVGVDAEVFMWECTTLRGVATGRRHAVGYPSREQAAVVSPSHPVTVAQDDLELVLRRHLATLPSVRFVPGVDVLAVADDGERVTVTVRAAHGVHAVTAAYVIGADGAHSTVRELLGVPTAAHGVPYAGVQVVFRADLWPLVGAHRYALYSVTTPGAPAVFLPAGQRDRWVYGSGLGAGAPGDPGTDPDRLAAAIAAGAGDPHLVTRIERVGAFESPGAIADAFRAGRTFLAGDAAHRVTPRGGTGMNLAIHDGHDLGWKLAWAVRGWAPPGLLASYEGERRPVVERSLGRSVDPDGSRREVLGELQLDLGGRLPHAWLPDGRSTLDLLGAGWTVLAAPGAVVGCADRRRAGAPVTIHRLDGVTARTVGLGADGAMLVRPDGVPAQAPVRCTSGAHR